MGDRPKYRGIIPGRYAQNWSVQNMSLCTHGMQKLLNECETYASKYGIKFNENKSVVLNFKGHKFKANPSAKLYLNGSLMKTAVSYTYVGHIINNNLNDK